MCPHYSDGVCQLEPEKGPVEPTMPVYYCDNKQRTDAFETCPVYKQKAGGD